MFGWKPSQPTPAQKQLGALIFDESIHVISSFELNRVASLTYGEMVCDEIFEMLEQIQSAPMEHSILAVQKSLVVTKHILIYGSEKCVNSAISLQRPIEALLEFNTILWAQKLQGASSFMYRLKGGGVDKGYPIREAAKDVHPLLFDLDKLRRLRNSKADPNSLVPVGDDNVAFVSDEVRHYILKKRIEEQYKIQTRSNLVKAEGGFGAGYSSRDGKAVVGAAHSLDEMIKLAELEKQKFTDQGESRKYQVPNLAEISEFQREPSKSADADLLWSSNDTIPNSQPVGDLLDFSAEVSQPAAIPSDSTDLLGTDFFAGSSSTTGKPSTDNVDIFLNAPTTADHDFMGLSPRNAADPLNTLSNSVDMMNLKDLASSTPQVETNPSTQSNQPDSIPSYDPAPPQKSVMASNEDRFAALDALDVPDTTKAQSFLSSARDARNKILGFASGKSEPTTSEPTISVSSAYGEATTNSGAASGGTDALASYSSSMPSFGYTGSGAAESTGLSSSMQGFGLHNTVAVDRDASSYAAQSTSGLKVSQTSYTNASDEDDGFVMGGVTGSGLEPTAPAPGAPPPPPPP